MGFSYDKMRSSTEPIVYIVACECVSTNDAPTQLLNDGDATKGVRQNKGAKKCQKIQNIVRGRIFPAPLLNREQVRGERIPAPLLNQINRRMSSGKLIQEGRGEDSPPALSSEFSGTFLLLYFVTLQNNRLANDSN